MPWTATNQNECADVGANPELSDQLPALEAPGNHCPPRYVARVRRETGSAPVLPILGALALLESDRTILPMPEGMAELIWSRLEAARTR